MDDLDRWTRVLQLGSGAFGQVHLAWDTVARRWVAVKRFTGQDELGLLRFVIESRIRVEHPHLVRTLAFRLVDDRAWLVTELARGGSMRQLMNRSGPLPWGWVAETVDQLLDALVALHATGVVHRDLKPANLLLRDAGAVRPHLLVGDFGIATWRTVSMTGIGAAIGTPGYLAPEYLDGGQPAPATDLFAVGVLAAELLAGRRLVHDSNSSPAISSDWSTTLPLPDGLPTHLAAVLRRMADPDPERRYADCAQARDALLAAAPPERRGDLTTVAAPDLLADLPSGWTAEGPLSPETSTDSATRVPVHSADPAADPATALVTEPAESPPVGGSAGEPVTSLVAQPPVPSATPPSGLAAPDTRARRATKGGRPAKRRGRRVVLLLVLLLLLGGAGTLWVAALTRTVPGLPTAGQGDTGGDGPTVTWVPVIVGPCTTAELNEERTGADGRERCQRHSDGGAIWVREPEGGFPTSNPSGPFEGEDCRGEGDTDYTPVGDQVVCTGGTWRISD